MLSLFLDFNGRINRTKFCLGMFGLIIYFVGFVFALEFIQAIFGKGISWFQSIFLIPSIILPFWSMCVLSIKRLHDTNRTGWWCLLIIIGTPYLWYLCGLAGDLNDNDYGDGPGFDISDEIAAMANQGQPKPAFIAKSSFSPPVGNTQPSQGFGQAPKPMFGSR
jgi:uncharacterized membrane protein YhaH (DUF805 family)